METLLIATVNISVFYFLWFFGYRKYFIHSFRHELFCTRDELFGYAKAGSIAWDNPAFLDRWIELNSMIKLASHTHTLLFSALMLKKRNANKTRVWFQARAENLNALTAEQREFLENNYDKQVSLFGGYLVKSSFILMVITVFYVSGLAVLIFAKERMDRRQKIKLEIMKEFDEVYSNYYEASLAV